MSRRTAIRPANGRHRRLPVEARVHSQKPVGSSSTRGALQGSVGNRALARALSRPVLQRMVLALDDMAALGPGDHDEGVEQRARVTGEAVRDRVGATRERVVRPQNRVSPTSSGGLAHIGRAEELRVFGHGGSLEDGKVVAIGGYTPDQLVTLLVQMGLPREYVGEVYLAGCRSAHGEGDGFLGAFYDLLRLHCPGVVVRGNTKDTLTFPEGTQGVLNDVNVVEDVNHLSEIHRETTGISDRCSKIIALVEFADETHPDYQVWISKINAELERLKARQIVLHEEKIAVQRRRYDTTGRFTVQLPHEHDRARNAVEAVVRGVVTIAEDVEALLRRITPTSVDEARTRLGELGPVLERQIADLRQRTERLAEETPYVIPRRAAGSRGRVS